jgi:hypothetical protein
MSGREMSTVSIDLAFLVAAATSKLGTKRAGEIEAPRLTVMRAGSLQPPVEKR